MSINLNDCSPKAPWPCHQAEFPRPEKYGTSQIVRRSRSVNACDTSRFDAVVLCLYSPYWYLTVLDWVVGPRRCVRQFTTLINRFWVTARFDFQKVSFREELQLLLFLDVFDQRADSVEELRDLLEVVIRFILIRHDGCPERTSSGDSAKASSDLPRVPDQRDRKKLLEQCPQWSQWDRLEVPQDDVLVDTSFTELERLWDLDFDYGLCVGDQKLSSWRF